mgnify:CR=1 FL=1
MVYFIYFVILVSFIDTFSQLPIISPYAQGLGATPLLIGIVVGIYSFSNIIGNIFAGFWIDKDGAKRVLYIALALTGLILGEQSCPVDRCAIFAWFKQWLPRSSGLYFFG